MSDNPCKFKVLASRSDLLRDPTLLHSNTWILTVSRGDRQQVCTYEMVENCGKLVLSSFSRTPFPNGIISPNTSNTM